MKIAKLVLLILLFSSPLYASEFNVGKATKEIVKKTESNWAVTPIIGVYIPMGSEGILQDGLKYGLKVKYKAAVLKLQRIDSDVRYVGQRGIDLSFNTLMVGFEHEFNATDFGVFGIGFTGGVAVPDYEEGYQYFPTTHSEGLWRHTNQEASFGSSSKCNIGRAYLFDKYKVDYSASAILEVELNYKKPFKYGSFFMSGGYTYLSVQENINAKDEPNINGGWSIIDQLDCSGAFFMAGFNLEF